MIYFFEDGNAVRYNDFGSAMRKRFGAKTVKLALSGGMTCPNRDGTVGSRGCIFCGASGGGDFASGFDPDITAQIERAAAFLGKKADGALYIAYFQPFTNTYAPVERLRELFTQAISHPRVAALSVATRPDCLPPETVSLLAELAGIKPVWVELGLQTTNEKSAEYIRRGYPLAVYDDAVARLRKAGVEVITHVIIGLPGETKRDAVDTSAYAGAVSDGIKLQLLHVLSDSDLCDEYARGVFRTLELDEYLEILAACVEVIPERVVIHRLTGDGAGQKLVAPRWSADKKRVLGGITAYFEQHDIRQGSKRARP